jgi:hypothetical protein
MFRKAPISRWLVGAVILAAVECAGLAAVSLSLTTSAQAQYRDDRYPFLNRRHQQRSGGGFFEQLFGPFNAPRYERQYQEQRAPQHVDHSRAPSQAKRDKDVTPTTTILVMGDGMADWLAYGLEDAFSDAPEVAVTREAKQHSGLIRYENKGDLDWWHVARDVLSREKANYVVMMLGLNDRENIREKDLEAEKQKEQAKAAADAAAQKKDQADAADKTTDKDKQDKDKKAAQPTRAESDPAAKRSANGIIDFRSDRWAKVYSRRIDETIAALKSKGVPVFWVGLPSIRGTKSTADAVYLNDLFRARAERAGINFIDVWDGFVDDSGKYSSYGPDYEGQTRRLRSSDGVFFTKSGARKLAHYVEREIRRYMSNRALQVSLPSGPIAVPEAGKSAVRPVVGPVVPLTTTTGNADQLLGGGGSRPIYGDAIANDVLKKGEPVAAPPGRADNFVWQGGDQARLSNPAAADAAPASGTAAKPAIRIIEPGKSEPAKPEPSAAKSAPKNASKTGNAPSGKSAPKQKTGSADKRERDTAADAKEARPVPPAEVASGSRQHSAPQRTFFPFNPLGWLR